MPHFHFNPTTPVTSARLGAALLAGIGALTFAPFASAQGASVRPPAAAQGDCAAPAAFAGAAAQNAKSLNTSVWSVFGHPETGWEVYAPLTAHEIGVACAPSTAAFAAKLANWQGAHALPANGVMDAGTLDALRLVWTRRRPYDRLRAGGACPRLPRPDELASTRADESNSGKAVQARSETLAAYRKMVAAARAEVPAVAADPHLLTILTGYRDPGADTTSCSSHRTGWALDLFLGAAPGFQPDSADDANRLYQSRTAAYRWLVANAGRFGFTAFALEPRHWEWSADPPR